MAARKLLWVKIIFQPICSEDKKNKARYYLN